MLRKKIRESLSVRVFLLTALLLLGAGGVTFGLIAWATPITYTAEVNRELTRKIDLLAEKLEGTTPEECGPLMDEFIRSTGADAALLGPDGQPVDTGSLLAAESFPVREEADSIAYTEDETGTGMSVSVTMSEEGGVFRQVRFAGKEDGYFLRVIPGLEPENLAVKALIQMAPWLLLALLLFSLLCAFLYSRYMTRPILRLGRIAGRMAELDFDWECGEDRRDEIGDLSRSLNRMARRLSAALEELEAANRGLRSQVEQERELDRQRMAFFSAASHELKTPVTILKGQLSGMLEGVDVYRDRDKYLLRSLQVTGRMESLIREMLEIARMETGGADLCREPVEVKTLLEQQLSLYRELMEERGQRLVLSLAPGLVVTGDAGLLGKAVGNLLSNASLYSPEGARIRVWCGRLEGRPALTVENTGVRIGEEALSRLFEAFYREEGSRNRSTGGSGLGLYLTRMILERHGADCGIDNTAEGVRATIRFVSP